MKKKIKIIYLLLILSFLLVALPALARQGCCSHHGGVCSYLCHDGINNGYYCCDGSSLSATCAPYYSKCPAVPIKESKPEPKPETKPLIEEQTKKTSPAPEPEAKSEPVETNTTNQESKSTYTAQAQDKIPKTGSYNWIYWLIGVVVAAGIGLLLIRKRK